MVRASVAITDLDGDGNLDLAVANAASNSVSLLRGNGDGKPDLVFSLLYAAHISVFVNSR